MARPRNTPTEPPINLSEATEEEFFDDLTEAEVKQAAVGSLIRLQGPEFERVNWSIRRFRTRQEVASDPSGEKLEWVADHSGGLYGKELIDVIGGGTFNALGYVPRTDGRGVRIAFNETFSLAGPRKDFSGLAPSVVTPGTAANGNSAPDSMAMFVRLMERSEERFNKTLEAMRQRSTDERMEQLIQAVTQRATAPSSTSPMPTFTDLLGAVTQIVGMMSKGGAKSESPVEMMNALMDALRQGYTMGKDSEPLPPDAKRDPDWAAAIEKALELGMQYMQRVRPTVHRPGPPTGPPNGPPRPPSSATVVETPSSAPEPATTVVAETPEQRRWHSALEALSRARMKGDPPDDFAGSLGHILDDADLDQLRGTTEFRPGAEHVVAWLQNKHPHLLEQFDDLTKEQGQVYLSAVLAALRAPAAE